MKTAAEASKVATEIQEKLYNEALTSISLGIEGKSANGEFEFNIDLYSLHYTYREKLKSYLKAEPFKYKVYLNDSDCNISW